MDSITRSVTWLSLTLRNEPAESVFRQFNADLRRVLTGTLIPHPLPVWGTEKGCMTDKLILDLCEMPDVMPMGDVPHNYNDGPINRRLITGLTIPTLFYPVAGDMLGCLLLGIECSLSFEVDTFTAGEWEKISAICARNLEWNISIPAPVHNLISTNLQSRLRHLKSVNLTANTQLVEAKKEIETIYELRQIPRCKRVTTRELQQRLKANGCSLSEDTLDRRLTSLATGHNPIIPQKEKQKHWDLSPEDGEKAFLAIMREDGKK